MKVSIFVGGVQKSGTRSFSSFLRHHPNVSVHKKKEGHFFDVNENFSNDDPLNIPLTKYHSDFYSNSETKVYCDITPDYIFRNAAITRIFKYNPMAHWVIFLRNPIERAYSAWNMEINRNAENLSFEDALYSELKGGSNDRTHDRFQYIGRSKYHSQIQYLWKYFPKSQCHIYPSERLWESPENFLLKVLDPIGIPKKSLDHYQHTHKGVYKQKMSDSIKSLLMNELKFEMNSLPDILGWNSNPWVA